MISGLFHGSNRAPATQWEERTALTLATATAGPFSTGVTARMRGRVTAA